MKKIDWHATFRVYGLVGSLVFLFACVFVAHIWAAVPDQRPWRLFGERTYAAIDAWTLQHFLTGVVCGRPFMRVLEWWNDDFANELKHDISQLVAFILIFAFGWEGLEVLMDNGTFGADIAVWKVGFEHMTNRFITDPAMVLGGAILSLRYRWAWVIAAGPCAIWNVLNYGFLDNSMVAHNWIVAAVESWL